MQLNLKDKTERIANSLKEHKKRKFHSPLSHYSSDGKAAVFTLAFAYLYLIFEIAYAFKVNREVKTWSLIMLFLMFAAFGVFRKLFAKTSVPRRFDGKLLDTDQTKKAKRSRNRYYLLSATLYGAVFAIVNFLSLFLSSEVNTINLGIEFIVDKELPNYAIAIISSAFFFILITVFAYMIDFLWYEYKVSAYNEEQERIRLEEEALADKIKEEKIKAQQSQPVKRRVRPKKETSEQPTASKTESTSKKRGRPKKTVEQ